MIWQGAVGEAEGKGVVVKTFEDDVCVRISLLQGICHKGKGLFDEEGTGAGSLTSSDDEETVTGTGKGDVEQVEVVDSILQMFMAVVCLEDGAHHLLLTVVDGDDGKVVEGGFRWLAPEDVTALLLQLPVTERNDDMLVLQPL